MEERPAYIHYSAVAKGGFGPGCHPENKAGSGCGIYTLGGHLLCGVMVCSRGIAAYLRAGFSLGLFIGNYEESYVMTSGSHFLVCSPLACSPWRQQADLSEFGVCSHLMLPNNKEWNERDEISVTYVEVLAKLFSSLSALLYSRSSVWDTQNGRYHCAVIRMNRLDRGLFSIACKTPTDSWKGWRRSGFLLWNLSLINRFYRAAVFWGSWEFLH